MTPAADLFDPQRLDGAEEFRCERLHCGRLRRVACGLRYRAAQDPLAAPCLRACAHCEVGELHAQLVVGPVRRRRRVGDSFRSQVVTPRTVTAFPVAR